MSTETTITEDEEDVEDVVEGGRALQILAMSPDIFSSYPLPESGSIVVGRSSKCDVQLEDPMVSREHARLHISSKPSGLSLTIEDTGSANGTRVGDAVLKVGQQSAFQVGEALMIGSTVLMVLPNRAAAGPRRLWSHAYFEAQLQEHCARAATTSGGDMSFALARVRFVGAAPWHKVLPIVARYVPRDHMFAVYGPRDYEILLINVIEADAERLVRTLERSCEAAGLSPRFVLAWYGRDGRNADTLIATANARLRTASGAPEKVTNPAPEVAPMQRVRQLAARVAASPINVLILGECGVGKDVLANLIHKVSPRADKPFVAFNCAALSETVLESELFGHERGAFTGAASSKLGLLESANGGTVFLDEIGDMPEAMQAKLLRAIENREVRPVGAVKSRIIDVRFISATNRDIDAGVAKDLFRRDLLDRLNTMTLVVPPLRERRDEIPALVATFLETARRDMGRQESLAVSAEVMSRLLRYRWPGNIRELKNVIERAVALCDGPEILPEHLPLDRMDPAPVPAVPSTREMPAVRDEIEVTQSLPTLTNPREFLERQKIIDALATCHGNQTRAADLIGMPRRTFVSKLDLYGIPRPQKGWALDRASEPAEGSSRHRRVAKNA